MHQSAYRFNGLTPCIGIISGLEVYKPVVFWFYVFRCANQDHVVDAEFICYIIHLKTIAHWYFSFCVWLMPWIEE